MKTKARQRRRVIAVAFVVWLIPGGIVTYLLRNSLGWVQVQSYLAILLSLGAWYSAETPVENE